MDKSIFEYDDYKKYLHDLLDDMPKKGRGLRQQIATAVGCQLAYVSHVLVRDRDFSLEQAEALTRFLRLEGLEREYFMSLVQFQRAGTAGLKNYYSKTLQAIQKQAHQLSNRVSNKKQINPEDQAIYYSSWHFQAVRTALSLPGTKTPAALAKRLSLPMERVEEVLGFLFSRGLVVKKGTEYHTTDLKVHLGAESPLIGRLHSNWRTQTLGSLDRRDPRDLHYSGVMTLARKDYQRVRDAIMKAVLNSHKIVEKSEEEILCVMAADFYEL